MQMDNKIIIPSRLYDFSDSERLKRVELLLESSLESPQDMIILSIDQDYNYLYFNRTHARVMKFTYGADVKIGMNIIDAISSETDKLNSIENYGKALRGISHSTIQEYGDKDIRIYESFYNPIYDDKQVIIGATAFARDITDKVMAERQLKDNQILMDSLFNSTSDAIYVKDLEGKYLLFNASAEMYFGKKAHEVIGSDDTFLFPDDDAKVIMDKEKRIRENLSVETFEETIKTADGKTLFE